MEKALKRILETVNEESMKLLLVSDTSKNWFNSIFGRMDTDDLLHLQHYRNNIISEIKNTYLFTVHGEDTLINDAFGQEASYIKYKEINGEVKPVEMMWKNEEFWELKYDDEGLLASLYIPEANEFLTYEYDEIGRILSETVENTASNWTETTEYVYDPRGHLIHTTTRTKMGQLIGQKYFIRDDGGYLVKYIEVQQCNNIVEYTTLYNFYDQLIGTKASNNSEGIYLRTPSGQVHATLRIEGNKLVNAVWDDRLLTESLVYTANLFNGKNIHELNTIEGDIILSDDILDKLREEADRL